MLGTAERYLRDTDEAHGRIVTVRMGESAADDVYDLRMLADLWRDYGDTLASEAGSVFRPEAITLPSQTASRHKTTERTMFSPA